MNNKKAVILASGGVDSSTLLKYAENLGYEIYVLSFNYGQRHNIELSFLSEFLKTIKVKEHKTAEIDLRIFGGSALTDNIKVPNYEDLTDSVPITYVPARNTIFLSYALSYAEVVRAQDIFIGIYSAGYVDYPDCKPEFVAKFNDFTKTAIKQDLCVSAVAPFINFTKTEIVKLGLDLGVDYGKTLSCYNPSVAGEACGKCSSCFFRLKAFAEAGAKDPALYQNVT